MLAKALKKIASIARKYNINERTGQHWWNQYKNDPDYFFVSEPRGDHKKLHEEFKEFLIVLLDKDPSTNIDQTQDQLTASFEGLKIGKLAV